MEALIIVDVQNDFCKGGTLAVPEAETIFQPVNKLIQSFTLRQKPIFFTRDWHPKDHSSFIDQGGVWPPHCIAGSLGACFSEDIIIPLNSVIISKAKQKHKDAYSAFEETPLNYELKEKNIDTLIICGLATDYCVKNTVIDAIKLDYNTILVSDGIKAVNVKKDDGEKAIKEMCIAGAILKTADEINESA